MRPDMPRRPSLPKCKPIRLHFEIPIYEVSVWLVVDEDAYMRRVDMADTFGEYNLGAFAGLCAWKDNQFGLFFYPNGLTHNTISHEVTHLALRIMKWIGFDIDPENHEPLAYLQGYLTALVYEHAMKK
jgi:hypothetical protein